jgi:hypothetical protein
MSNHEKDIEQIKKMVWSTKKNLEKIEHMLVKMETKRERDKLLELDGVEGVFDGFNMTDSEGKTYEVPANYAAKSRLVFGDKLKMVEKDGRQLFKQLEKVPRKTSQGIATKKEGLWYAITDTGSYKISDVAAEFNEIQINEELVVIIPEDNLGAPFAALDKVIRPETEEKDTKKSSRVGDKKEKTTKKAPGKTTKTTKTAKKTTKKTTTKKKTPTTKKKTTKTNSKEKDKEFVNGIAEDKTSSEKDTETKNAESTIALEEDDLR